MTDIDNPATTDLTGRRILVLTHDYGVEQDEIVLPVAAYRDAGAEVVVAAPQPGPVATLVFDKDPGATVTADVAYDDVDASDFDALLLPGGTINADTVRSNATAVAITGAFVAAGRPVASICHGPWTLVETGALKGKTLTSWRSITTDVRNAGGTWVDDEVVVDGEGGWVLVTSRSPHDMTPFLRESALAFSR